MQHLERDERVGRIEPVRDRARNGLRQRGCETRAGAKCRERRREDDAAAFTA
jgi:hypothetical protein